ncbi:ABC transporter ATP-binding protein [Candidatus Binatus soli]|jgi:putative ABC transport system ATP-binding protein|uniref:ABC transporter ATP-binding protein n=1 Tax=Candidatus Binatus soli TaxID=1953413 RepID=UPI003D1328DF
MPKAAIAADKLNRWFGVGEARTYAVKEVSFEANWGEMLYIVGPSGSGKTTLLSMISGILRPNSGSVAIDGRDLWSQSDDEIADFRLNTIGFVFQDYHLFPRLTTAENVAIPLILQKRNWGEALSAATQCLKIVDLADKAQLPPTKLSGGEQQRVAIARAIVHQPRILVFDEPTASLDGETGRKIVSFVKAEILTSKRCIIMVTHDSRIFEYSNRIMEMEDGRITGFQQGQTV